MTSFIGGIFWYLSRCLSESITRRWRAWERDSGSFFFIFSPGTYFICIEIKCKLELSQRKGWEQRLQSKWIDGLWMPAGFYSRARIRGKCWLRQSRIFMTGFILIFLNYHKFPQPYLKLIIYCVDADVPNICLYCDSVLRQVEQEKMQQNSWRWCNKICALW